VTRAEHPDRYSWWLNELESLGIRTLSKDDVTTSRELVS
jgi:hypothetical protein